MSISERTRKLLWGRSGNRCAICRRLLVVEGGAADDESIVGEECHIVGRSADGPRGDSTFARELLDEIGNLVLLCRVHHKVIDDQVTKYSIDEIRRLKAAHERWVEVTLSDMDSPVRIVRSRRNIPATLDRVISGQRLLSLAASCMATCHGVPEHLGEELATRIGGFLENLQDYRDVWDELGPAAQLQAFESFTAEMVEFEALGLGVFVGTEVATLEGGVKPPSRWNILHLVVRRFNEIEPLNKGNA